MLDLNVTMWVSVASGALALFALAWLVLFEVRLRRLFRGSKAQDLEAAFARIQHDVGEALGRGEEAEARLADAEKRLRQSAQHMAVVRFNPYADAGGDQSFALAVLDEHRNGFVLSSLYGRDTSRVFAKPIAEGASTHPLTKEEEEAIRRALEKNA